MKSSDPVFGLGDGAARSDLPLSPTMKGDLTNSCLTPVTIVQ